MRNLCFTGNCKHTFLPSSILQRLKKAFANHFHCYQRPIPISSIQARSNLPFVIRMKPTNIPIFRQRDPTQSAWLIILFVFILTINKVGFTATQVACECAGAVTKRLCIWAGAVVQKPPIETEKT